MAFLLDQDVYAATARFVREAGHDVVTASDLGMSRASDRELLAKAAELNRIFATRDRDFGSLVFLKDLGAGVIYLRVLPATLESVHNELAAVLAAYTDQQLRAAFVVVEPARHRFRLLKRSPGGQP